MSKRVERAIGRGLVVAASFGLLISMLSGCTDRFITRGISARNETPTKLHFAVVVGGESHRLAPTLEPNQSTLVLSGADFGQSSLIADERCIKGDLVALSDDGSEIGRHPPPLCIGDTWTISAPPTP